jgi:hypothetical protein
MRSTEQANESGAARKTIDNVTQARAFGTNAGTVGTGTPHSRPQATRNYGDRVSRRPNCG